MTTTRVVAKSQIDVIDSEMIDYMARHGKVKAGELAELVGITVSSIRVRLFQLMALGVVSQEKTRNHHVFFFVTEKEGRSRLATTANGDMTNTAEGNNSVRDKLSVKQP